MPTTETRQLDQETEWPEEEDEFEPVIVRGRE